MLQTPLKSKISQQFFNGFLALFILLLLSLSACSKDKSSLAQPDLVQSDLVQSDSVANLSAEEKLGAQVYTRNCAACHLLTPNDVKVGPSLHGIADNAATRVAGQDARTYIITSVLNPSSYVHDGFEDVMPKGLAKSLTSEELDAVVAYLLTLH